MLQSGLDVDSIIAHHAPVDRFEEAVGAVGAGERPAIVAGRGRRRHPDGIDPARRPRDMTSDGRAAALALAARGWSVVPMHQATAGRCSCRRPRCPSVGKHPRVLWERWMSRRAGPTDIELWWDRWPEANVGVVTGWVSALVVVDVDPRNGGDTTLAALEAQEQPLPATVTSLSGGGGRHLYFAHPTHLVPSRPLGDGVDLKAEGGVVVVPPSEHASGQRYRWQPGHGPDRHHLAALPDWIERLSVTLDDLRSAGPRAPAVRTEGERATFLELWAELGVDVEPREFMARCPLHDDHHPSLHVDPEGCRWFCFGCRRGGGIQALRRIVHPESESPSDRPVVAGDGQEAPTLAPDRSVDAVGESTHQDELLALTGGRRTRSGAHRRVLARLEPVDDNPFDPLAVAVMIEERLVGYLSRRAAEVYRPMVEETIGRSGVATCLAEIRGGWERPGGDIGRFGVVVLLPDPARNH
jgi:hypothetical protein